MMKKNRHWNESCCLIGTQSVIRCLKTIKLTELTDWMFRNNCALHLPYVPVHLTPYSNLFLGLTQKLRGQLYWKPSYFKTGATRMARPTQSRRPDIVVWGINLCMRSVFVFLFSPAIRTVISTLIKLMLCRLLKHPSHPGDLTPVSTASDQCIIPPLVMG